MKAKPPKTPEHRKLKAVQEKSQAIGDFLNWLAVEKSLMLYDAKPHEHTDDCRSKGWLICGFRRGERYPASYDIIKLLAEFFNIDTKKIDAEKQAILDHIREMNK